MEITLSKKQKTTIEMMDKINGQFNENRWITKGELPGVTQHTIDALLQKEIIEHKLIVHELAGGVLYYKLIRR